MEIQMKATLAGPGLHLARNQKYDLAEKKAQEIVSAGLAVFVSPVIGATEADRRERAIKKNFETR